MKTLTKAEEQVMLVLWKLDKAFLREVVEGMPNPKPHQNTVATLLKILVEKEFVGLTVISRHHQYYPQVTREEYAKKTIKHLVKMYFDGSASNLLLYVLKETSLSVDEQEAIIQQIKKMPAGKK